MISCARISKVITEVCKKLGIDYSSPYIAAINQYHEDVKTLARIYTQLKQIIAELYDIEQRYEGVNDIRRVLEEDITLLERIDHDIIKEAYKIKNKKLRG